MGTPTTLVRRDAGLGLVKEREKEREGERESERGRERERKAGLLQKSYRSTSLIT